MHTALLGYRTALDSIPVPFSVSYAFLKNNSGHLQPFSGSRVDQYSRSQDFQGCLAVQKVAHLLGRTEGSFQRVCRALGIVRWPYRVRKSLQAIMEKTEQYLVPSSTSFQILHKNILFRNLALQVEFRSIVHLGPSPRKAYPVPRFDKFRQLYQGFMLVNAKTSM